MLMHSICEKNNFAPLYVFYFTGRTNVFPFGTGPPPYFMRNFMQAVAGHMVHSGITTTTMSSRNPPVTTVGAQQSVSTSMDSGNVNTGQSTQARYNNIYSILYRNTIHIKSSHTREQY